MYQERNGNRCSECGKAGRYKKSVISKEHRARLVI